MVTFGLLNDNKKYIEAEFAMLFNPIKFLINNFGSSEEIIPLNEIKIESLELLEKIWNRKREIDGDFKLKELETIFDSFEVLRDTLEALDFLGGNDYLLDNVFNKIITAKIKRRERKVIDLVSRFYDSSWGKSLFANLEVCDILFLLDTTVSLRSETGKLRRTEKDGRTIILEGIKIQNDRIFIETLTPQVVAYFSSLPKYKSFLELKFQLSSNINIKEFLEKSTKFPKHHIDLQWRTQISQEELMELYEHIKREKKKSNIIGLDFSHCKLNFINIHLISRILKLESNIQSLSIGNNEISDHGMKYVCEALSKPDCRIVNLNLSNSWITEEGMILLASTLNSLKLKSLNLSANQIEKSLFQLIYSPLMKIENLNLSSNYLGEECIELIHEMLVSSDSKIETLDLSSNYIGNDEEILIYLSLKNPNCQLKELNLSNNQIRCKGIEQLCSSITSPSSKLQTMDLSSNFIRTKGSEHLAAYLSSPSANLKSLNIAHNVISLPAIFSAMTLNQSLEYLNVGSHYVKKCNVQSICDYLINPLSQLVDLDMHMCEIDDAGASLLAKAVGSQNCNLKKLNLSYNQIGVSGYTRIMKAFQGGKIGMVDLTGNNFNAQ